MDDIEEGEPRTLEELVLPGIQRAQLMSTDNIRALARAKVSEGERYARLMLQIVGWALEKDLKKAVDGFIERSRARNTLKEHNAAVEEAEEAGRPVFTGEPVKMARQFIKDVMPHLVYINEEWLNYEGNRYVALENHPANIGVRSALQKYADTGVDAKTGADYIIARAELDNLVDALRNLVFREGSRVRPPAWLEEDGTEPPAHHVIAVRNGLLDVRTGDLMRPSWTFFTRNGLEYNYIDPAYAPRPERWLQFLDEVWPIKDGLEENHLSLAEMFGYCLSLDTSQHKIFLLNGIRRGGKGTVGRVLLRLIGDQNTTSKKLNQLYGSQFSLQSLIGSQLLYIADMQLDRNAPFGVIAETLLTISGEDKQEVGRKFISDWAGKLNARIVLAGNKHVMIRDQAGALLSRYLPYDFVITHEDHMDPLLSDKLYAEMPGILNWSLDGLRSLHKRGHFAVTDSARKTLHHIGLRSSPVHLFNRECLMPSDYETYSRKKVLKAFIGWMAENGLDSGFYSDPDRFTEALMTSEPAVEIRRVTDKKGLSAIHLSGVTLKPELRDKQWPKDNDFEDDEE
jgi:hypothetical protein